MSKIKYIVNNATGQTISGDLIISGKTSIISTAPTSITGSTGDKMGGLAFDASYPFNNVAIDLECNGNLVDTYYTNNGSQVNNITELVDRLNSEPETNFFGTFSDNGDGAIKLTITTDVKNMFCEDGTITFRVFQD